MTSTRRGTCTGCGQQRQVVASGLIRSHMIGTTVCGGSFKYPAEGHVDQPQRAPGPVARPTPPPTEPTYGRSCDGGGCDTESIGWRWYRGLTEWLPVCGLHMAGPQDRTRIYDQTGDQP